MYPGLALAGDLEELLHELAAEAKTDRELAELLFPRLLLRLQETLGRPTLKRALEDLGAATAPKETPALVGLTCAWTIRCDEPVVIQRWDERAGIHKPVCRIHSRDATPMELRPYPNGTRTRGGKTYAA
jgi:hypothetical protein